MSNQSRRTRPVGVLSLLLFLLLFSIRSNAATMVWGGGNGTFSTAANWIGGAAPGSSDTASFSTWGILPAVGWTATASTASNLNDAIDGRRSSRWSTGTGQTAGQWYKVDMGASNTITEVDVDATTSTGDYPRGWSLDISTDDSTYTNVASGTGTTALVTITFSAQTARYIKITQTLSGQTGGWWSIGELWVTGTSGVGWSPLSTSGWTASSNKNSGATANVFDADLNTRWTTNATRAVNDYFKVDMGSSQTFNRIQWDAGQSFGDYPDGYTVDVSTDNSTWTTVGTGTGWRASTDLITTQTARYIRMTLTTSVHGGNWSISEFSVYTSYSVTQLSRNGWTASASVTAGGSSASNALDGNSSTSWASGVNQASGQWFKIDMTQNVTVNAIAMDSYSDTGYQSNFWTLSVSTDDSTYTPVVSNEFSLTELIQYSFSPQTARYIKVTLTGSASNGWAIHEFNVYGCAPATLSASTSLAAINMAQSATLNQGSGNTLATSGAITQSAGTFSGGNSLISVGGAFNLSGGTFTSTSGVLKVGGAYNQSGGTFTHNSGTVTLASSSNQTFASNGATFYNLAINDGLVGYWKLDEGSGTTFNDSSGYAFNGTLTNSPTWSTGPTLTFTDSSTLTVNGTNQYGRVGRSTIMEPAAVTVTAWLKRNGSQTQRGLVVCKTYNNDGNPTYASYEIGVNPSGSDSTKVGFTTGHSGTFDVLQSATNALPDATWTHVAMAYDPSGSPTKRIYINGVLNASSSNVNSALSYDTSSNGDLWFGQGGAGFHYYNGSMDEVRIYSRALTASEIYSLYAGNQPGTGLATETMTGAPTVANNLTLASGTLAAGANGITVTGSWNNYGGIFTSTGTVTLNSTGSKVIRSAGQPFYNLTLNGSGGTWTLDDWMKVTNTLTFQNGTLSAGSNAVHAGNISKTSGSLTAGTGSVVLDSTSNQLESSGFSFNNLRIEAPDETGLVGYWKFDEGQGRTVRDSSGTGNDGTLTTTSWTTSLPAPIGFDNHAGVTFDGTTSIGTLGTTSMPKANANQSISFWVNSGSNSAGTDHYMLALYDSGSSSAVSIGFIGATNNLAVWKWGPTALVSTTAPSTGAWHHVVYTYSTSGTTSTLYLDGVSVATGSTAPNSSTPTTFQIGGYGTASYTGSIDDLRVYNVTLTARQVANLYAGRYSGVGTDTIVTLGANSSASGTLAIDSGTLASSTYTMNASSSSNVATIGSGGTYTIGSATQTMAGGMTVYDGGTLNLNTANGALAVGIGSNLFMNGTLNASSTSASIQSSPANTWYTFSIGNTPTSRPTLNIVGLQVKNPGSNGMYIGTDYSSITTFTHFDNIAFSKGGGTGAGNYNLRIHAYSLYLTSNGCTFDNGASATVANNVKLDGNGTADGETRVIFGNATCASDKASCEAYDGDDDSNNDGVGDNPNSDGAVIQWISGAQGDTSGSIEGFPTAAFDWSSFTYYATYVEYHDANATADRVYVRTTNGSPNYYWDSPSGVDLIGAPRWDTTSGTHYVYVATTSGKVYRLVDNGSSLAPDTASPWNGANNPFDCSCTIATPLGHDTNNLYFGGSASGTYKLWTVSKTSTTRQPTGSPLATGATTSNAAPAIWASGDTYVFLGQAGRVTKLDTTTQALSADNTNPGSSNAVSGRITIIFNKLYAGDDNGFMWSLDPGTLFGTVSGTYKIWSYNDTTNHGSCGGVCQVKSHYVDAQFTRVYYGDQDGHLYVLNSSGAAVTGYPWRPGSSAEAFATAPLYRNGVIVIGATDGFLYVIDQNSNGSVPALIQTYRFGASGTSVSGVAYDGNSGFYMVSTANATNKDGKLYYITASNDPTGGFP